MKKTRMRCVAALALCLSAHFAAGFQGGQGIEELMLHRYGESPLLAANRTQRATMPLADALHSFRLEVEYELRLTRGGEAVEPINKIVLAIVVGLNLGWLGVDRCLFGQVLLGVAKGATCGGCCCWWFIDTVLLVINFAQMKDSIDVFYMKGVFQRDTVKYAFWVWLAAFIFISSFIRQTSATSHGQAFARRALGSELVGPLSVREVEALFQMFDKDGNGTLDPSEFQVALIYCGVPEKHSGRYCRMVDRDRDGKVDIEEFSKALRVSLMGTERRDSYTFLGDESDH